MVSFVRSDGLSPDKPFGYNNFSGKSMFNRTKLIIMRTFSEKERFCDATFQSAGPYWHAFTSGKDTPLIFADEEAFAFGMNTIAMAANIFGQIRLMAFEVMGNHFHFVLSGKEEFSKSFWDYIRKRLSRSFPVVKNVALSLKPIDSLQSMRNNIVYTNRNGYVSDSAYTPFSYPWGTGRCYFLEWPVIKTLEQVFVDDRRKMFRCRTPDISLKWAISDGYVSPESYCAIKFGMSMFRDAHHYFSMLSKNVEANAELAAELGDSEFLTDQELFGRLTTILKNEYGAMRLRELGRQQKKDLAVRLRRDFRSSNGQIRRVLGLTQYEIDALFPLSAEHSF